MRLDLELTHVEDKAMFGPESTRNGSGLTAAALLKGMASGLDMRQAARMIAGGDPFDSSLDEELEAMLERAEELSRGKAFARRLSKKRNDWVRENAEHPLKDRAVRLALLNETLSRSMEKRDYSNVIRAVAEARREADDERAGKAPGSALDYVADELSQALGEIGDPTARVRLIREFITGETGERI